MAEYVSAAVYIHSWDGGDHLQTITPPQLGLQENDDIHAVLWREKIHSLLLVTGPDGRSSAMRAYTVSSINVHADHSTYFVMFHLQTSLISC